LNLSLKFVAFELEKFIEITYLIFFAEVGYSTIGSRAFDRFYSIKAYDVKSNDFLLGNFMVFYSFFYILFV